MIQVIKHKCCGKIYSAATEPECYTDKEYMKDLRKSVLDGDTVEMVETFEFGTCECKKEIKVTEPSGTLFDNV